MLQIRSWDYFANTGVQHIFVLGLFSSFCQIKFVCINVAVCDLVHDVETVFRHCNLLTASGNLLCNK